MKRTAVIKRNAHGIKKLQVFPERIKSVLLGKYTRKIARHIPDPITRHLTKYISPCIFDKVPFDDYQGQCSSLEQKPARYYWT